jgi:hypothetical protein
VSRRSSYEYPDPDYLCNLSLLPACSTCRSHADTPTPAAGWKIEKRGSILEGARGFSIRAQGHLHMTLFAIFYHDVTENHMVKELLVDP